MIQVPAIFWTYTGPLNESSMHFVTKPTDKNGTLLNYYVPKRHFSCTSTRGQRIKRNYIITVCGNEMRNSQAIVFYVFFSDKSKFEGIQKMLIGNICPNAIYPSANIYIVLL